MKVTSRLHKKFIPLALFLSGIKLTIYQNTQQPQIKQIEKYVCIEKDAADT